MARRFVGFFLPAFLLALPVHPLSAAETEQKKEGQQQPADPKTAGQKISLMVTGVQGKGAISQDALLAYTGLVAGRLTEQGIFRVITSQDVEHLIEHDELVTTLNGDDVSALSAIGKAVGTAYLVTGSAAKTKETTVFSLSLFEMKTATHISRETLTVKADRQSLVADLRHTVDKLTLPLRASRSGLFVVRSNEEGATVYIDDKVVGATPLHALNIAAGPHRVAANKDGFVFTSADVVVQPERTKAVDLVLVPAQDYLEDYRQTAWTFRTAAFALMGVGAASALSSAGLWGGYIVREGQIAEETNQQNSDGPLNLRTAHYNELNNLRIACVALLAAAVPIAGAGAVVFVLGDPPERYDALVE